MDKYKVGNEIISVGKYTLLKKIPTEKYYEVLIEANSNNDDYGLTVNKYTQNEFDNIIDELKNLKNNYMGDHKLETYDNLKNLDIPCVYYGYCHTLISLFVTCYDCDGCVYDVAF